MEQPFPISGRLELDQRCLKSGHVFDTGVRDVAMPLQRPGPIDDLNRIVAKFLLQIGADRFGIACHIAVESIDRGGLTRNDL